MRYNDLTTEQTKALLDAIRALPPNWQSLDDAALLALLTGGDTEGDTGPVTDTDGGADPAPAPDPDPEPDPDPSAPGPDPERETAPVIIDPDPAPAIDPTPQGAFSFSVPTSGWGAESYRVQWGDESAEIAQSRGNRASLADIERALESLAGVRDVEVTAPGPAARIEGLGDRPYRVEILDADPGVLLVIKGNGKFAAVRTVDDADDTAPADPGATDPGATDPGAEQTPTRQGAIVIEIPFSIQNPEVNPLTTDYYAAHAGLTFYGPNADSDFFLAPRFNYGDFDTRLSVKDYWFRDYYNGGTQRLDNPAARYSDNLKSGLEAALESLPNIATAEVITLAADHWRIAITEGPGGLSHFTYDIHLSRFAYEHEGIKWGGGHYGRADSPHFIELPQQSGAAQLFTFDAVTSGTLTLGERAAFDMALAEGDGATEGATADPPAAWQMGLEGGFDGNLQFDYIGA